VVQAVVNTRQREAFLLVVVLLGAAWGSRGGGPLAALGAFIAPGRRIEYSHQALSDILPRSARSSSARSACCSTSAR
jgi:hypothetical protein